MKKLYLTLVLTLVALCTLSAQLPTGYPQAKLIEAGEYDKAAEKLLENQENEQPNAKQCYALGILYSSPGFRDYNLEKAYVYMCKAMTIRLSLTDKEAARLAREGYTQEALQAAIDGVAVLALDVVGEAPSVEAYNRFLKVYSQASESLIRQAVAKRDHQAWLLAEADNTIEAYKAFVQTYPDAQEASEAAYRLHQMEYDRVRSIHTEQAYETYVRQYPQSHMIDSATYWWHQFEMERLTASGTWTAYADYFNNHIANRPQILQVEAKMYALAYPLLNVDRLRFGVRNFFGEYADSCAFVLHDVYAREDDLDALRTFYDTSRRPSLSALYARDSAAMAVHSAYLWNRATKADYIHAAAPYTSAYKALLTLIRPDIRDHRWQEALDKVLPFAASFGNDPAYSDLLRTLSAPEDQTNPQPFPATVNTPKGSEYSLAVSADDRTIYFTGRDRPDNIGGEDIFMTRKDEQGHWGQARLVNDLSTSYDNDAPLSVSADGTSMLLFKTGAIYEAVKTRTGWIFPERMCRTINGASWQSDAMITSDGQTMIFAARKQTPHELRESCNIFVSIKDSTGAWGEPFDLGPVINTPGTDRSPVLHPDMHTLYFCSDGHSTLGGLDVFVSTRLSDDSWTEWSTPVNIGRSINTLGDECWYKISTDGTTAYYSKMIDGHHDMYSITLPEAMRPRPVATISGVMYERGGRPVSATIRWENLETGEVIGQSKADPADGNYFIVLPEGKIYGYFVDHPNYYPISQSLDLRGVNEPVHITRDIELVSYDRMLADNLAAPLNNLFFDVNKADLLPFSIAELKRVARIIKLSGLRVEISGHTDSTGDPAKNQQLSEQRARSAYNFLIAEGCSADRLTFVGYGDTRPVADNTTDEGKQKNRRVEIRFLPANR